VRPVAAAVNAVWWASSAPGWWRFERALRQPGLVQRRRLAAYLRANAGTVFGRQHRFCEIRTIRAYQDAVPLTTYDDYRPYVERIAAGDGNVLTRSPVRVLEPTGGSTSAAKLIPFTSDLRREFTAAVAPWVFTLLRSDPSLLGGPAYWSITPSLRAPGPQEPTVRIGFEDDARYLGGPLAHLLRRALVVPPEIARLQDLDAFRRVTALLLLACADLRLISVWHPSFLSLLAETIRRDWHLLTEAIHGGALPPTLCGAPEVAAALRQRLRPDPRRAAWLESVGPHAVGHLWPRLGLISCWADGHAAAATEALRREFPRTRIQPKGLLSTEACVTLPRHGAHVLAIRSHFFEFLDDRGEARLAHELERGGTYSVLVTTGGGLYRYRLEDRVEATGWAGETPTLRFVGREGHVADRFGEKLHAGFVAERLRRVLEGVRARFAMLAPESEESAVFYVLYIEATHGVPRELGRSLEGALRENPHYRYCVELGQLRPLRVFRLSGGGYESYVERCVRDGQRLGDVKPVPLDTRTRWSDWFCGGYVDEPGEPRRREVLTI
jgi:hypothetical protein